MFSSLLSRNRNKNRIGKSACAHPTTLLLSVHKGASSFLSNDFGPAIARAFPGMRHIEMGQEIVDGKTVEDLPLPPTGVVASRVYPYLYDTAIEDPPPPTGRFSDKKLIMLRRDPRDVAVSLYYSIRFSHTSKTRDPEGFLNKKSALEQLDVVEGVLQHTSKTAISQFLATRRFLDKHPHTCLTTYEALTTDFPAWRARVIEHMGWSEEDSAKVFAGLVESLAPPKKIDPYKHKRRVTPGNWREVFDERLRELFERRIGRELTAAGYTW
jgi:hypothetical protein